MPRAKPEPWVHYESYLFLPGLSEIQLAYEVRRREVEAIEYALKNGQPNKNFSCVGGGCKSPPAVREAALPFYSYEIAHSGKPVGIRRVLKAMCKACLKQMLGVWEQT